MWIGELRVSVKEEVEGRRMCLVKRDIGNFIVGSFSVFICG